MIGQQLLLMSIGRHMSEHIDVLRHLVRYAYKSTIRSVMGRTRKSFSSYARDQQHIRMSLTKNDDK